MSRFKNLSQNKLKLIESMYEDDQLVKALICDDRNFLSYDIGNFDRTSLVYSQIYPYLKVPKIIDGELPKSYITMGFNYRPYKDGKTFKLANIDFYAICHESIMSTDEGLRVDFIVHRLDDLINQSRLVGIGKMLFGGLEDRQIDGKGDWMGSRLSFRSLEFG